MNCNNANRCIQCTVTTCANHCNVANYCSLDCISIGTNEHDSATGQCTSCKSYTKK